MKKRIVKNLEYIWQSVGYIIHLSCMIEQNVKLLISGEEFLKEYDKDEIDMLDLFNATEKSNKLLKDNSENKVMLGGLIKQLKKYDLFKDDELISDLENASKIRGYYAHEFFKKDLVEKHLETDPLFYKEQIENDVHFLYSLNAYLFNLVLKYQKLGLAVK